MNNNENIKLTKNLLEAEDHWMGLHRGDCLPYRSDYGSVLKDYEFLLENVEDGSMRLRHVGYWVEALFGGLLAGRDFYSLFSEAYRNNLEGKMQAIFDEPAKVYLTSYSGIQIIEFCFLPISADFGVVNYALGVVNLNARPQQVIGHLGLRNIEVHSLRKKREELKYGFAEDRMKFQGFDPKPFSVIEGDGQGGAHDHHAHFELVKHVKREP